MDEGIQYGCASVCIPPAYVKQAAQYAAGRVPICTVIGFPTGTAPPPSKRQRLHAVGNAPGDRHGGEPGWVKDGLYDQVEAEIRAVKNACQAGC